MTHASPDAAPLTAVLAGLGGMGEAWLSALTGPEAATLGVTLTGVCEAEADRAVAALAHRGLSLPIHEGIADALSLRPDIVVDCTTPNARLAMTREALLSGAHVLCEGPLATDQETMAQLIGASARSPGHLAVNQSHRFQPGLRQLRSLVRAGTLGRPQTLLGDFHMAPRFGDIRNAMRHVLLRNMAVHAFDSARAILCADATFVACQERTPEGQPFQHAPEAHASFEMTDGSIFHFRGNWAEPGPPSSWHGSWRLTLSGGAARWNGKSLARAWTPAPADRHGPLPAPVPHILPPAASGLTGLLGSLESLVMAIRAGRTPETHARDNAASLAMVFAAIRSAENSGRREPVRRLGDLSDASALLPPRRATPKEA